ncbi:MAG: hypothetical protein JO211_00590, partial [Acidobacteriaceae bacterium]|nr:hypothetical protein [Acidobacteriaceae bacterium]
MRFSLNNLFGRDRDTSAIFLPITGSLESERRHLASLIATFKEQSAGIRSVVAVGCHEWLGTAETDPVDATLTNERSETALLRTVAGASLVRKLGAVAEHSENKHSANRLDSLAVQARELFGPASGDDLLLLPADLLDEMMAPVGADFSFRAIAALLPKAPEKRDDGNGWRLRRALFDRGLICIGCVPIAGTKALCFLASDAVRSFDHLDIEPRGNITMSGLTEYGLFGNQLFRYACVKLYAFRHGLTPAFPQWEGRQLFGLGDKSCAGLSFPTLEYPAFADNDREFWDADDPPINIDLKGYFQELPECWRKHRPLLRHMFELVPELRHSIEGWHDQVTEGGRRTLVAIHLRRGDYRKLQNETTPWFRIVPEGWYVEWLRTIWPTLRDPILFIGTDDPHAIRPLFEKFETVSATGGSFAQALPHYIRDFEILRRADYLAICNSSFSRMAAILAPSTQKCFLPSFESQCFEPYDPWMDPDFWPRFADSWLHKE